MTVRVYRLNLRPLEGLDVVRQQIRAAHEYRNDLVAIERGRRSALRAMHQTPECAEAEALVRAATRSTRKEALRNLAKARRAAEQAARCEGGRFAVSEADLDRYAFSPLYELERIALFDASIRRDARALTSAYWGTYLTIEASADQVRKMPLYGDDGLEPNDPKFQRWTGDGPNECGEWRGDGQIGVQLQGGLSTPDALAGKDTRIKLILEGEDKPHSRYRRHATLSIRVGSLGRAPVWAKFSAYLWRAIPDDGVWKWVRVSYRQTPHGDVWSAEITLDSPTLGTAWRSQDDRRLAGAVAVELAWWPQDDGTLTVASWLDSSGSRGILKIDPALFKKASDIRSLRDLQFNELQKTLPGQIKAGRIDLPDWLARAANTLHLWRSMPRLHLLYKRWQRQASTVNPEALAVLRAWYHRDRHLWQYEAGVRRKALGQRKQLYRETAARWAQQYRVVLVPDRNLSKEARWGEESDRRFQASPQELRNCLRAAFGEDAVDVAWRGPHGVVDSEKEDALTWLETAIEQGRDGQKAGGARGNEKASDDTQMKGGAWAKRRAKKQAQQAGGGGARETERKATG